jgi:hypothetical protein
MSKLTLVKFPSFKVVVTGRHQVSVVRETLEGSDEDCVEVHRKLLARSADSRDRFPTAAAHRVGVFARCTSPDVRESTSASGQMTT